MSTNSSPNTQTTNIILPNTISTPGSSTQTTGINDKDIWTVGVLTTSDRVSQGQSIDQSGPEIVSIIKNQLLQMMGDSNPFCKGVTTVYKVVPDEIEHIQSMITQWTHQKFKLILTTGGTGFTPRDVTPEAIKPLLNRRTKGIEVAMLKTSLDITPHAMLSRPVAGIRDQTLIVTLPGSVKAIRENLGVILPAIPHAIGLICSTPSSSSIEAHRSKDFINTAPQAQPHPQSIASTINSNTSHGHGHGHGHSHSHGGQHGHSHSCNPVSGDKRGSKWKMTPVDEAIKIILEQSDLLKLENEKVDIVSSLGRIIAQDVISEEPFPSFRASIKDGYAVRSKDGIGHYKLLGDSVAGGSDYKQGEDDNEKYCIRVTTGAMIPDSYDAVVMIEDTEIVKQQPQQNDEKNEKSTIVSIEVQVKPGQDIRAIGSDIPKDSIVLKKGDKMGCSEIGLLATLGIQHVECYRLPKISIISTGDELVDYKKQGKLEEGMIRDSNTPTLETLIKEISNHFGKCASNDQIHLVGIVGDKIENLESTFIEESKRSDIIITSGGVSMGHLDLVKPLLEKIGKVHFGRVNMKPGKPLTFSTITSDNNKTTLVFSLPGNPVSSVVCFYLFVVPSLRRLSGFSNVNLPQVEVKLLDRIQLDHERPEYHRCYIEWDFNEHCFVSKSTGSQASCRLLSLKQANALLVLPQKEGYLEKGTMIKSIIIGPLSN